MAVQSTMVPLGTALPAFTLPDVNGAQFVSTEMPEAPALVMFLCNHCPYVRHIEIRLGELLASFPALATVGICTNDSVAYPEDAPVRLAEQSTRVGWTFAYLVDSTQDVGREFGAACTPDFFLYDADGRLVYRGAFDESTPGNGLPVTGELLDDAIRRTLAGEAVPEPHRPSMGCSIKWRS